MSGFEAGGVAMALVVGGLFTLFGWGSRNQNRHRDRRGVVTTGVIVAEQVDGIGGGDVGLYGFPVVEFTDTRGGVRRFTHPSGTNVGPAIGSSVPVWYDPEVPDEPPVIHREPVMTVFPYLFLVLGLLVVIGALATAVFDLTS